MRAACHVHSEWSYDGRWPLPGLARAFGRLGYRVVMVSDHDRGFSAARWRAHRDHCARASSDSVIIVPGIEYSDADNIVHVLVWGPVPFLGAGLPTLDLLRQVSALNGLAVLAHPSRRDAWKRFDARWTEHLLGMEVWNRKTDGWAPSVTAETLINGTSLVAFAGVDFHDWRQTFPLAMELELGDSVTEESVLDCLRSRRCRAMAFSSPIDRVLSGWRRVGLKGAEEVRRRAARVYRWVEARRALDRRA